MATLLVPFAPGKYVAPVAPGYVDALRARLDGRHASADEDLQALHGDDHDGQFCPTDLEYWTLPDAEYRRAEWEMEMEAEAIAREREAEIAYREACTYRAHVA